MSRHWIHICERQWEKYLFSLDIKIVFNILLLRYIISFQFQVISFRMQNYLFTILFCIWHGWIEYNVVTYLL
jgi:hypothetical protein